MSFDEMREFTRRGAEHYGIDPSLAFAMFEQESQWNPKAISPAGAIGVAQLMPETAKGLGVNPHDTWENIDGGLRYLKQQLDKYKDPSLALAAYNAGPGAVDKAQGVPQNIETPAYVQKVMSRYNDIRMQRFAAGKEAPGEESKAFDVTKPKDVQGGLLNRVMTGLAEYGAGMLKAPSVMQGSMGQGFRLPQTVEEAKMPTEQWLAKPYIPEEQKSYQLGEALASGARNFLGTPQLPTTLPEQAAEGVGMGLGFMGTLAVPKAIPTPTGLASTMSPVGALDPLMMTAESFATAAPPIIANAVRPALLGSAISQVGGYERARESLGVQDALDASRWNGLAGLTMGFPYGQLMSRIDKGTGGLISSAIKSGIEMTGSMALMKTLDNVFDKLNYDEKRAILHGVVEGAPADFIVGSLLGALGRTIRQRVAEGKEPELAQEVREYDERSKSWWIKTEHGGWYEEGPGEGPPGATPPSPPSTKKTYSDSKIEKKVRKVEVTEYGTPGKPEESLKRVERIQEHYWKEYGIEFEIVDAPTEGKFMLRRVKAEEGVVPAETPPTAETIDSEHRANHEANAAEIPENVPPLPEGVVRTKEPLTEQQRRAIEAGNEWFRQRQEALEAKSSEKGAGSVNRVDKGVEGKTEAEQMAIDDAIVDSYEKTKSYVQTAKEVGLSIAETKARYKYATGKSEKRPYDIVEEEAKTPTRETPTIESPLVRIETEGRAPGVEVPKMFDSKLEADAWLMDNKMVGTPVSTGGKFKILDMRPAKAYELFSFSPFNTDPLWFSKLQTEIVKDYANWPKRMSGSTALEKIAKLVQQGKGKKEELDDMLRLTGLKQRLEGMEGVSKDDVLNEIMSNGIEVEEVWRGRDFKSKEDAIQIEAAVDLAARELEVYERRMAETYGLAAIGGQNFTDWTTPEQNEYRQLRENFRVAGERFDAHPYIGPKYENTSNYNLGGPREGYFELVLTSPQAGEMPTDSSHFIEGKGKRQIGWVRGDWRTDADGKRILFIEEVQSKRHQGEPDPTAPFQKSWLRLISRRLLRYAAENNADAVAWTTGEQQAERWSLRQVADEMQYRGGRLFGWREGQEVFHRDIPEKDLPSYIGKEFTQQLLSVEASPIQAKFLAELTLTKNKFEELTGKPLDVDMRTDDLSPEALDLVRTARIIDYQLKNNQHILARTPVPEGIEFYSSKWPEKIYGFAKGGYEKSLLATAMKEAMGQFKGKVGETGQNIEHIAKMKAKLQRLEEKRSEIGKQIDVALSDISRLRRRPFDSVEEAEVYENARKRESDLRDQANNLDDQILRLQDYAEKSPLTEFSRQPSVTLTKEAKDFWRQNPMQLYSLSPNMITTENVKGIRDLIERNLEFMGLPARGYKADDIGWLESWAAQTQWLVDKNPRLYPIFEATHRKMETAASGHQNAVEPWAEDWVKFSAESKRKATDFEVQLDQEADRLMKAGKTAYGERGITEPRFLKVGRGNITLNPKFHDQWAEKTRPLFKGTDEEFNAILEHRKMYDKIAEVKWNIGRKFYKPGSVEVKQLRHETFMLQDYLPHQRDGEFALTAYVKDAEGKMVKVYDYSFDVNPMLYGAQKMGRKYEVRQTGSKASFGTYRDAGSAEIAAKRLGEDYYVSDVGVRGIEGYAKSVIRPKIAKDPALARLQIPEENWVVERRESKYIQSLSNNPLVAMALESTTSKAIREIEKSKDLTPEQKALLTGPYKKLWNNAIAQTLKKGTLGGHWSHRSGIAGYDVSDAGKIAYNYAEQFYKTLAQAEMASELTKLAKNIKGDRPNEAKFAARYMERVLSPEQELSKAIAWTRSIAYYTLLNPIKFFGINVTNGLVGGAQQIVVDAGNAAWKQMPKAMWDTMGWYSGTKKLAPMEERLFRELYNNGVARPQFLDAMGQRIKNDPNAKSLLWEQFKDKYSWPARTSEIASRLYTALAAFRAANDGLVTSKRAVDRFGEGIKEKITGEMTEEQYQRNMRYAAKIVDDSHMIWGEINRPDIVTRGPAGKALGSALIFRHYGQGLFHMWKSMLGEGKNGKQAFLQSLAAQSIFGGVVAGSIWNAIYQQFMGTSMWDDLRKLIGSKATDVVQYGAPTLVGFNLHSSFALEPPDSWDELFGAPASLVKNYKKFWQAATVKDYQKAFEYLVPLKALRDLSVGLRLYGEGLTTAGGSPIPGPESNEPFKISGGEMVKQWGGFTPLSTTQLWESKLAAQSIDQRRQEAQDGWVTRYVNALRRGDEKEINSVIDEAVAWNEKWIEKGVPQLVVDLSTAIKQRVKPAQPPKMMRGLAREMQERALRMQQD